MKKCILWENWVSKTSRKGLGETLTIKKHFLTFTLSVNKIIIYQFSMFKSLDSTASVVGIFMHLTISKFKQVLRSGKVLGKVSTTTLLLTLKKLADIVMICVAQVFGTNMKLFFYRIWKYKYPRFEKCWLYSHFGESRSHIKKSTSHWPCVQIVVE